MKALAVTAGLVLLTLCTGVQAVTIDTVTVGDPGNVADTANHSGTINGQGSVAYTYNIGKYEVTAGQYCAFLNAVAKTDTYGLYHGNMWTSSYGCRIQQSGTSGDYSYTVASDYANRPVNWVSYWDACRFANWLGNGQKSGVQDATTTERGAYALDGYIGTEERNIQRNANWKWAVASEDEWYKAAYYKGGGTNAGYWMYPTQSDRRPGRDLSDVWGNNANYYGGPYPIQSPYYTTVVGEFQNSESAYGTFDQGGNLWEWTGTGSYTYQFERGGSFYYFSDDMRSMARGGHNPSYGGEFTGFRVSQAVPEPSSMIALLGGSAGLIGLRRRKA